jgi:hypothetical protein
MQKQAIIAKYKEDISWTKSLEIPIIIYDKSDSGNLPNIGRDLHTYAHHIATNYDNLADISFFIQGNPFDHCADLLNIMSKLEDTDFQPLTDIFRLTHKSGLPYYSALPLQEAYQNLSNKSLPELIIFISGAQFAASRDKLRQQPQSFYVKMAKMANHNHYYPHIFERLIAILIDGETKWGINNQHPKYLEYVQFMLTSKDDLIVSL